MLAAAAASAAAAEPQTHPQASFGGKGGVPAAITASFGACCQHAEAALACLADRTAKNASKVKFGNSVDGDFDEVRRRVKDATVEGLLTEGESQEVFRLVEGAFASGVWPLWRVGENHYAVFEEQSRGTEHRWAHVQRDKLGRGVTPKRVSSDRDLMCKVGLNTK